MSLKGEAAPGPGQREDLLQNIRRLTAVLLDKLEEGSREKLMDHNQMRLLGSIALRSLRLWKDALREDGRPSNSATRGLEESEKSYHAILDALRGGE